jgi:hypothetical protein
VPLDLLFSDSIRSEWLDTSPYNNSQFQARIEHSSTVSDLLDRAYNRIWMLVHRSSHCLAMGDVVYLRTLIQFTLIHVNVVRHSLRPTQKSFGLMATDTLSYLPNDIPTKVDRAAKATSLETRAPFLDHRVASVAWRLPMAVKIRPGKNGGTSKWVLRQILTKHVPHELIERPKVGFAIPVKQWLRDPLRSWADDLLDPHCIQQQGYFKSEPIMKLWLEHKSGRFDHTTRLWPVLTWQSWVAEWLA